MKKILPYAQYFRSLHRKPSGSGVLFFDRQGRVLILKTTYRDGWIIPGGIVDEGESPTEACIREIKEELGLKIKRLGNLLCVDYKGVTDKVIKDDSFQFIFNGGRLTDAQIKRIKLDPAEHAEFAFVTTKRALKVLNPRLAHRLPKCLKAMRRKTCLYLECGNELS